MKTKLVVYCDSSTKSRGDRIISRISSIILYQNKIININIQTIDESDNNTSELYNVIQTLFLIKEISHDIKSNHPIIIYNDCRYAIDTINQFLVYIKKIRGIPDLLDYYKENNKFKFEKTNKYYSFKVCKKRIEKTSLSINYLIDVLLELMDTNKIIFKWIPREDNIIADKMTKTT